PAYAGLLGSEAVRCYRRYGASPLYALEIELRDVQHYIDSDKPEDINKALKIISSVNEQQKNDTSWKDSLLFGQFTLWKGIAEFWKDNFDEAIDSLKEGWRIFITYDEQQDLVYLAENWIGYVSYRKADFVEAEYWMKISLEGLIDLLSKELDNKKRKRNLQQRIQYSLGNLAILYRYTGRFIEAIRYAEMALNIVQSLPRNKKEILRSLNTLSHVLAIAGRNIDARHYLEEAKRIYKEIPDRLLGGRVYSNFCQLSYGTMEFAHLIEYYRAEELHKAVENSSGTHVQKYIDYAEKAIDLLEKEPVFHKELADAYFSLGELYMMMPANHPAIQKKGDKWELAEQAFEKALESAKKSQFQYRVIDTLESLVTLYYFQSQTVNLSPDQKRMCEEKQKQRQNEIEEDWKIQQFPNLAGRYELTQGDIHFDKALEFLKEEYPKADNSALGVQNLLKAFTHYANSAAYKKKFNINRHYLMLRVIYNRLDKLVELAHPLSFLRLESLDYQRQEAPREEPLISRRALSLLAQDHIA
ncbi:MAG: tetratricopeptide repeat protein, partial [Candidatus Electrothrix sp. AUS1_2]|nr:tetratricopeptide repeat protein [Candidatus Electrothrix sp. AUS1_2]